MVTVGIYLTTVLTSPKLFIHILILVFYKILPFFQTKKLHLNFTPSKLRNPKIPSFRAMLPPEPSRSRASELRAELHLPPATGSSSSSRARGAAEVLLSARQVQRLLHEEGKKSVDGVGDLAAGTGGTGSFWQRHAFGRSSRRTAAYYPQEGRRRVGEKWCCEMFRRAPAHTEDAIKAVLAEKVPKAPQTRKEQADVPKDLVQNDGTFDWSSPYSLAYNSAGADLAREEKWQQQKCFPQLLEGKATEITYGYDVEDVKLMKESRRLDHMAGGGLAVAHRILALKNLGVPAEEFLPLALRAASTAFEMPKEMALQISLALLPSDPSDSSDTLSSAALALLSSAAARARDAEDMDFPVQGLETLALSGLGWKAFSNMFLAALHAQLQRQSATRGQKHQLELDLAQRVMAVFTWAAENFGTEFRENLSPAGRRVARAVREALFDKEASSSTANLEMLEMLTVRDVRDAAKMGR